MFMTQNDHALNATRRSHRDNQGVMYLTSEPLLRNIHTVVPVSYTHLDVYKRQL